MSAPQRQPELHLTAASPQELERLLGQVEGIMARETGPVAWLRSRSTAWRRVVGISLGILVPLGYGLAVPRVDLGLHPVVETVSLLLLWVSLLALLVFSKLASLGESTGQKRDWPLLLLAVIAVALPPLLAPAHELLPASLEGAGTDFWARAIRCFTAGAVLGLVALALVAVLDRSPGRKITLAAGVAGIAGVAALQLHCPIVHAHHLWLGHAAVLYAALAVVGLGTAARALQRRRGE